MLRNSVSTVPCRYRFRKSVSAKLMNTCLHSHGQAKSNVDYTHAEVLCQAPTRDALTVNSTYPQKLCRLHNSTTIVFRVTPPDRVKLIDASCEPQYSTETAGLSLADSPVQTVFMVSTFTGSETFGHLGFRTWPREYFLTFRRSNPDEKVALGNRVHCRSKNGFVSVFSVPTR